MAESTSRQKRKDYSILLVLLVVLGIVLVATTIRGPFIIDEINYLVTVIGLREGKLTVPGTEGLSPSKELFAFDPEAFGRIAARTPVASLAPPLYAPIALPFSAFNWRGLVFLNTLSFLLTALLVFALAKQYAVDRRTPWLASALVLLGGYGIEYSQGVWPHMLSVVLVTSAVFAASKAWRGSAPPIAMISGLLIGIATGVREQNIVVAGCLGLTVLLFANRRIRSTIWFGMGAVVPLLAIATMNSIRDHLWHPFPKFVAYSSQVAHNIGDGSVLAPLRMFWAKFVDYSTHPAITYPFESTIYRQNPESGAFLVLGTLKKAFLQSSPWVGLAFVVLLLAWFSNHDHKDDTRKGLQALSLLIFPLVLMFSFVGAGRTDGLAYNQRYFLEIIPLAALAIAFALDGLSVRVAQIVAGVLGAGIVFAVALMLPSHSYYEIALLRVPLIFAVLLILSWLLRREARVRVFLPITLGLCLGWAFFVHTLDDLPASRARRSMNAILLRALEASIPDRSAVFAYWGSKDVAGPLMLTRDVVVLDAGADEGADAARLTLELQRQHRRIFILTGFFPRAIIKEIVGTDSLSVTLLDPIQINEVLRRNP